MKEITKLNKLANLLQHNVQTYLENWEGEDLARLGTYLGTEIHDGVKPNEKQQLFINEFIGESNYNKFIDDYVIEPKIFISSKSTRELIIELTNYVTFYATKKLLITSIELQLQKSNLNLLKIKLRLSVINLLTTPIQAVEVPNLINLFTDFFNKGLINEEDFILFKNILNNVEK